MPKLLLILLSAVAAIGLSTMFAFTNPEESGYKVGDVVTDFSLQNVEDDSWVSLSSYGDVKGYIIAFTCNTCPYAQMYEERLIALHKEYAPQGYPVVAINPNDATLKPGDSYAEMKKRAAEKKYPFKYLIDADQTVFPVFGATRTPHIFLVDQDRVVRYIGAIDNNAQDGNAATEHYVASAIEALKKGDDPNPNYTKAIGCTIKVKS